MTAGLSLCTVILFFLLSPCYSKNPSDERILLGFEDIELGKIAKKTVSSDTTLWLIPSYAVSTDPLERPVKWKCVRVRAGNGAVSSVYLFNLTAVGPEPRSSVNGYPDYARNPGMNITRWAMPVFKTADCKLPGLFPEQDWSGFDLLRMDLHSNRNAIIWISVEDSKIEPPVTRRFNVKADEWVTLESDIKTAEKERGLNLKSISNIIVGGHASDTAIIMLDNIRISRAGAVSSFPVIAGAGLSQSENAISQPAMFSRSFSQACFKKQTAVSAPVRIRIPGFDKMTLTPCGWLNSFDDQRMFLAFTNEGKRLMAVQTVDGGKTWTGLAGDPAPVQIPVRNLDHGTGRGQAVGSGGVNLIISSIGCAGGGIPSPRQKVFRIMHDGEKGWSLDPDNYLLEGDIRHCSSNSSFAQMIGNRIWCAWGHLGRDLTMGVHAKYSDDLGITWHNLGAGTTPEIPGSFDSAQTMDTYQYKQAKIFNYGNSIGVAWRDTKGLCLSLLKGKSWVSIPLPPLKIPNIPPGSGLRPALSVVSVDSHIFITTAHVKGVLHWDGVSFRHELDSAWDGGFLALSGKTVMLVTPGPGYVEADPDKWITSEICYYERSPAGKWSERRSLTQGPVNLLVYRGIYGVSVPAECPPNRVPVAFNGKPGEGVMVYSIPNSFYQ